MMNLQRSICLQLVFVLSLSLVVLGDNGFQAFYFMQQIFYDGGDVVKENTDWLGSYCNQQGVKCCYPETGKPGGDFTIYGLWPYFSDGSFPKNCQGANFNVAPLKPIQGDLQKSWPSFTCPLIGRKFWLHEWNKRGTCSKSILDEMPYFQAALNLKKKVNLLQILAGAGIKPDNKLYSLDSIKQAISRGVGFEPWIQCNNNAQGNNQIWQVTVCVDKTGSTPIKCPQIPHGNCQSKVQFPSY